MNFKEHHCVFIHYLKKARFFEKKKILHEICFYSGHILIKLEFSRKIFEKSPNIKDLPCEWSDIKSF